MVSAPAAAPPAWPASMTPNGPVERLPPARVSVAAWMVPPEEAVMLPAADSAVSRATPPSEKPACAATVMAAAWMVPVALSVPALPRLPALLTVRVPVVMLPARATSPVTSRLADAPGPVTVSEPVDGPAIRTPFAAPGVLPAAAAVLRSCQPEGPAQVPLPPAQA